LIRKINILRSIDWITILVYLVLILIGWINIYAAVYDDKHQSIFDITTNYGKQFGFIMGALIVAFVFFLIDSKAYTFFAYTIYGLCVLALLGVLFFGKEVHNSRSWFEIGFIRIQPAEFAKFATALAVSKYLSAHNVKIMNIKSLVSIAAIIFIPVFLIILQPDAGSALIYVAFIFVLYREGLSPVFPMLLLAVTVLFFMALLVNIIKLSVGLLLIGLVIVFLFRKKIKDIIFAIVILLITTFLTWFVNSMFFENIVWEVIIIASILLSGIVFIAVAFWYRLIDLIVIIIIVISSVFYSFGIEYIFYDIMKEHQRTRINVLLGIDEDRQGAGYNVYQSKIAIGSGGFDGKGFLQGTQTKGNFVPEQSTDFIFCTVGEEWGFLGTSVVILLFVFLLIRLIFLAERQRSQFSRIYGYSVASFLFFHFAINIGMTMGLAPVIGIPLPFFSYGGSSLLGFTILLFVFIRLDASRLENL